MKVVVLLALLSLSVYAKECGDEDVSASSYSDCKDLTVETGETCCYIESDVKGLGKEGGCAPVTEEEMKDLDKYVKETEEESAKYGLDVDIDVDCHSNYLSLAFLALLFILF